MATPGPPNAAKCARRGPIGRRRRRTGAAVRVGRGARSTAIGLLSAGCLPVLAARPRPGVAPAGAGRRSSGALRPLVVEELADLVDRLASGDEVDDGRVDLRAHARDRTVVAGLEGERRHDLVVLDALRVQVVA